MKRKILAGLMIFLIGCGVVYGSELSMDIRQKLENIRLASTVYDRNGKLIGNLYYYNRIWVSGDKIGRDIKNAAVAIEDSRFYQHNGIDIRGIARAAVRNIISGGTEEGGSTITQQLAKISLLSQERTISRKIKDMEYALEIERVYSKQEILEMYLNSIYLAHGNVGVEAASRYYFGKSANQLTLPQSALLAGMIQSPENYSPFKHPQAAKERRNVVLHRMMELKYITPAQYKRAEATGLSVVKRNESASTAGYFLDYVRDYLQRKEGFSEDELRFGGYKIYTTLDLTMQNEAERTMANMVKVSAKVQPQGALISLDPKTGGILAMVGGRSYAESQYNRTIHSYRQPGSAIKPFIYTAALQKGYTAATIMEDQPLTIALPTGAVWKPENYDRKFHGKMTLREGLRNSINSIAVQLLQQVGIEPVADLMEKMGINSLVRNGSNNDYNLAPLALGGLTKGVTPIELAAAYTPFANQGIYSTPYSVRKIVDREGKTVREFFPVNRQVIPATIAYIMTDMMKDVVENGTGKSAQLTGRPAAGKTGTTSDYTNAWFVGYTPDTLTAIWIGNDQQGKAMKYKNLNIGSATASQMWGQYMRGVTQGKPVLQFEEPPGIVWADVDPETGKAIPGWMAGNSYKEVFDENNVPESLAYKLWHKLFPGGKKDQNDQQQPADGSNTDDGSTPPPGI